MIENKYFIASLPAPALKVILKHCVENINTVRKSIDGSKAVFKLPLGTDKPASFNAFTEYNHENILIEMATSEWTPPEI